MEYASKDNQSAMPLISVIIAVLNAKQTLQHCLDSVANQTYARKELIIMDGGSTDGSVDILKANNGKIDYWKSEPDRGIYQAWNKALQVAHGDYVCFLGADDYWHDNDSMAKLAQISSVNNFPDLVSGIVVELDAKGGVLDQKGGVWNFKQMKKRMTIPHPGMLHHRRLFDHYGLFSENFKIAGDYEFLLRLGENVSHIFINDSVVCRGSLGLSRKNVTETLYETFLIQSGNQKIGFLNGFVNYFIAYGKYFVKKLLRAN